MITLAGHRHTITAIEAVTPGREGYLGVARADDGWGYALWQGLTVEVEP